MDKITFRLFGPVLGVMAAGMAVLAGFIALYEPGALAIAFGIVMVLAAGAAAGWGMLRQIVGKPLQAMSGWVRDTRLGESEPPPESAGIFGELAGEVRRMGHSLATARTQAEQEARLRLNAETVWTAERLKEFVRQNLGERTLFAISNRQPYAHVERNGKIECVVPPSGLVTALEPVMRASAGMWIAQPQNDTDMTVVDEKGRVKVPPDDPAYTLKRVLIPEEENKGFYYGLSNEGIWPLCHIAHTRPIFRKEDWQAYERANRRFAEALLEEVGDEKSPLVLIQDYHFALLPRMIRNAKPDARIALFWHIPWPNPEMFGICPYKEKILDGLLGADILGFHRPAYVQNFIDSVDRYLQSRILRDRMEVKRKGSFTKVRPYPIGIDFTGPLEGAVSKSSAQLKREILAQHGIKAEFLGVGVDRLDYTKGILERLWAIERFYQEYPSYVGKFTFIELGAPTRSQIERYSEFLREIDDTVKRINDKFATAHWKPVVFYKDQHDQKTITRYYKAADLCMVTSLHDGMNLVAMEYVAAKEELDGVLILSRFTGAADELKDASLVNPYDIDEMTLAIRDALEMRPKERARRMERMRTHIKEHNVFRWAGELIDDLCRIHPDVPVA